MLTALVSSPSCPQAPAGRRRATVTACLAVAGVIALIALHLPAFLCMGLHSDVILWDLCARNVLQGGVHARDAFENNLPGMLWLHLVVRSSLGWRSEVIRLVDFAVVVGAAVLLARGLGRPSVAVRAGLVFVLLAFYFTTSEWCHCQRDTWMLVPALGALALRARQVGRLRGGGGRVVAWAFLEGLLWAGAFWLKPFVAVPALACWLLAARISWHAGGRRVWSDGLGVLAGGGAAGVAGCAWLYYSGAWPAFAEILFDWNREYLAYDVTQDGGWLCFAGFFLRWFPWFLVHLVAVPDSVERLVRAVRRPREQAASRVLLAGLYLGWLAQAFWLQHLFDYVHVPPLLLGLAVLAGRYVDAERPATRRLLVALLAVCVVWGLPALSGRRAALWRECVRQGSTASVRDRLAVLTDVDWQRLDEVTGYLRSRGVRDGELTAFNMPTAALYFDLSVKPASRFIFLQNAYTIFRSRRPQIEAELAASRQRLLVCDLRGFHMGPAEKALEPDGAGSYPWRGRVVFRSGRYVVFRLAGRETAAWIAASVAPTRP